MRIKFQKSGRWLVYTPSTCTLSVDEIMELLRSPTTQILRKHHRSFVEKKQLNNVEYVVKQPNNKNNSKWNSFTTLYRDSEVLRDLKSQFLLDEIGIQTVVPVAALEKRKFGMVIDSKILYCYKVGSEITEQHYPKMLEIMNILHTNGYLHDDPHTKNFLQEQDNVFVIDCKPKKNCFFEIGITHNYISLARRCENSNKIYDLLGKNPDKNTGYRLVNGFINIQQARRALKNKLRKLLGINYKS